ncbi:MAG: hypothetical protein RLZZ627_1986 [Pseudomonadota bacterium]
MGFSKRQLPSSLRSEPLLNPDHITRQLDPLQSVRTVWIALSGGRDSTVLLDLCALMRAQKPITLKAVHVHHGLQTAADQWVDHCQTLCDRYDIPLTIHSVNATPARGESPEEAARNARYQVFNRLIGEGDLLLMAHHQNDQAETVLLQLLRGAGLEGISGMPEKTPLGKGLLLRPLLHIEAAEILAYAHFRELMWIEDPSNLDPRFDRNYLRHHIMPLIEERWPAASRAISRSARHAGKGASHQRMQQIALANALAPSGHFDLKQAEQLEPEGLRLAIRGWFQSLNLRMPSEQMVEAFINEFMQAGADRTPVLRLSDGSELQRYRDVAYRIPHRDKAIPCRWVNWREPLPLPGDNGMIAMVPPKAGASKPSPWDSSGLEIRYRVGGEKIMLAGRQGHHYLKDLFQERGIPPWVRARVPLLYLGETLGCVGSFWPNAEVFNPATWASSHQPRWLPPAGLDPTGALESLMR